MIVDSDQPSGSPSLINQFVGGLWRKNRVSPWQHGCMDAWMHAWTGRWTSSKKHGSDAASPRTTVRTCGRASARDALVGSRKHTGKLETGVWGLQKRSKKHSRGALREAFKNTSECSKRPSRAPGNAPRCLPASQVHSEASSKPLTASRVWHRGWFRDATGICPCISRHTPMGGAPCQAGHPAARAEAAQLPARGRVAAAHGSEAVHPEDAAAAPETRVGASEPRSSWRSKRRCCMYVAVSQKPFARRGMDGKGHVAPMLLHLVSCPMSLCMLRVLCNPAPTLLQQHTGDKII